MRFMLNMGCHHVKHIHVVLGSVRREVRSVAMYSVKVKVEAVER